MVLDVFSSYLVSRMVLSIYLHLAMHSPAHCMM